MAAAHLAEQVRPALQYVPGTEPVRLPDGQLKYEHALAVPFDFSREYWLRTNEAIDTTLRRENAQVVVLTPHHDVTTPLLGSLHDKPIGKHPVATAQELLWPDGEPDLQMVDASTDAESIYIVSPMLTSEDFHRVRTVSTYYKEVLGAKCVTVVCTSLGKARQDKNVDKNGQIKSTPLSIEAEMQSLAYIADRMIVVEPHSSATQAFGAKHGLPVAPVSPWPVMFEESRRRGIRSRENPDLRVGLGDMPNIIMGPDIGRNIAATRMSDATGYPLVSAEKHRIDGNHVEMQLKDPADAILVAGAIGHSYDDELSTGDTIRKLAEMGDRLGLYALSIMIAGAKCVPGYTDAKGVHPGWDENIANPILTTVFMSDAREPIGDTRKVSKVEFISLVDFIRGVIEADIAGVDFWTDPYYRQTILQEER